MTAPGAAKPKLSKLDEYRSRLAEFQQEQVTLEVSLAELPDKIREAYAAELEVNPGRSFDTHTKARKLEREQREQRNQLESVNTRIAALIPIINAEEEREKGELREQLAAEARRLEKAEAAATVALTEKLTEVFQVYADTLAPARGRLELFQRQHRDVAAFHTVNIPDDVIHALDSIAASDRVSLDEISLVIRGLLAQRDERNRNNVALYELDKVASGFGVPWSVRNPAPLIAE
jgi:hypothetical protein